MTLKELRSRYRTDKSDEYLDRYEPYFRPFADLPIVFLEIGVFQGESLRLWQDYFPAATIIGLDQSIPPSFRTANPRLVLYEGLQDDHDLLDSVVAAHAPDGLDIVIDDASHVATPTRSAFWHIFERHLKPGGIYAIEDWGTGYWPSWPDGAAYSGPGHTDGMVGLAKELLDECGWADVSHPQRGCGISRTSRFASMLVGHGQLIVEKRLASEGERRP